MALQKGFYQRRPSTWGKQSSNRFPLTGIAVRGRGQADIEITRVLRT